MVGYAFSGNGYGLREMWLHIVEKMLRIYNGSNEEV